jgi:hypothetical protein
MFAPFMLLVMCFFGLLRLNDFQYSGSVFPVALCQVIRDFNLRALQIMGLCLLGKQCLFKFNFYHD